MKKIQFCFALGAIASLLIAQGAVAVPVVTYLYSTYDVTDYSPSGLNIANDGYLFANWNQGSVSSGEEDLNAVNTLPAWMTVNSDQATAGYSWANDGVAPPATGSNVVGYGGDFNFATLTLPDGSTGLSGQFIDVTEAGNTGQNSDLLETVALGAGVPANFRVHVVTDNEDSSFGTAVRRVKMRVNGSVIEDDTGNGLDLTRNNIPDVHTFEYSGISPGDFMIMALRTTNNPIGGLPANILGAGIAGFMIEVIPEPTSAALLLVGGLGLVARRRRR